MSHLRGAGLIMILWQVKLICEFGAQKSGEQPDSSSLPAGGLWFSPQNPHIYVLLFLTLFCPWHALGCWVPLTQLEMPWSEGSGCCSALFLSTNNSWEGLESCWSGKRSKEKLCRDAFYRSNKPLAWLSC